MAQFFYSDILIESYCMSFFFHHTATTEIYTLSLHDALPISKITCRRSDVMSKGKKRSGARPGRFLPLDITSLLDRKSGSAGMPRPISYAVFCLKKKKKHKAYGNLIPGVKQPG